MLQLNDLKVNVKSRDKSNISYPEICKLYNIHKEEQKLIEEIVKDKLQTKKSKRTKKLPINTKNNIPTEGGAPAPKKPKTAKKKKIKLNVIKKSNTKPKLISPKQDNGKGKVKTLTIKVKKSAVKTKKNTVSEKMKK